MNAMTIIAAALLTAGAAYAQQGSTNSSQAAGNMQQDHETAGQKLRSEAHKLGQETSHALHRAGNAVRRAVHHDQATGAGPDHAATARQQRMDAAYADWRAKQNQQGSHG